MARTFEEFLFGEEGVVRLFGEERYERAVGVIFGYQTRHHTTGPQCTSERFSSEPRRLPVRQPPVLRSH